LNLITASQDENDEEPIFSPAYVSTSIPEDTPTDSSVVTITATDDDTPSNAMLRYTLSVTGDTIPVSYFSSSLLL
jgi:hypothetical protein